MARPILEMSSARAGERFPLPLGLVIVLGTVAIDAVRRLTWWGHRYAGDVTAGGSWSQLLCVPLLAACGFACLLQRTAPLRWWRMAGVLLLVLTAQSLAGLQRWLLRLPDIEGFGVHAWVAAVVPLAAALGFAAVLEIATALPSARRRWLAAGLMAFAITGVAMLLDGPTEASTAQVRGMPLLCYLQWMRDTCGLFGSLMLLAVAWPNLSPVAEKVGVVRFVGAGR